jgi:Cdc6-like AAA superfamily ATPase
MRSVAVAYDHWIAALRDQVLRPFIVEKRNDEVRNPRLFDARIGEKSPPRLIEGSEPRRLVVTEAMIQVSATARNVHSGSLGISGPRGVGKSTILQFFGTDAADSDDGDLRLVVPAPVDYEPREFIVHLFSQLCEAVPHGPADLSAVAAETRRHLEQLRYLRTYSTSWSASLTPRAFLSLARGYAKERAEQAVTLPELVDSFRNYSTRVASSLRSASGREGRVVIGIDEVDKIRDSDRAEAFLNDVKAIFGSPGCLYLVSLSEDAMAEFAHRTPSIRGTFDTAFDEVVPVGPMTYRHSEQLLFKRVTGVPRTFIACVMS